MIELSEIQSPFVYLEELDKKAGALLRVGEQLVTSGDWQSLPEYAEDIKQIVKDFEHLPVLLEQTHESIIAEQRRKAEERRLEEERQRQEREERVKREAEYEQSIANFRVAYALFQAKSTWQNTNAAIAAGEIVEKNPIFFVDSRQGALSTAMAALRQKHSYLIEVREAAKELLAEQAQAEPVAENVNESDTQQVSS